MPIIAKKEYALSAVAAPKPDIRPFESPFDRVLFMQSMLIGPIGAEIEIPIINPLIKKDRLDNIYINWKR